MGAKLSVLSAKIGTLVDLENGHPVARKATTPMTISRKLAVEPDDVLIMLWDAGIAYPTSPESTIRAGDVSRAERACGLADPREKATVEYWLKLLNLDRDQFIARAAGHGIRVSENARRLPKGALSKLERGLLTERVKPIAVTVPVPSKPMDVRPLKEFVWEDVGHQRDGIQHLTAEDIEAIHYAIAEDFRNGADPISPAGVRHIDLLESAASRPQAGMGDWRKYSTIEMAAAALMHSVVHNHPFHNGNKRTALVSMLSFLDLNGFMLTSNEPDLFKWTIRVASHGLTREEMLGDRNDIEVVAMARWIQSNSRAIDRGERVITWASLRRCLIAHGCEIHSTGNRGGRLSITRNVTTSTRKIIGTRRVTESKKYFLSYGGDGRQVSRGRIKELRKELGLSEEHGVDSRAFYGSESSEVDEFISIYRKTLARLARV